MGHSDRPGTHLKNISLLFLKHKEGHIKEPYEKVLSEKQKIKQLKKIWVIKLKPYNLSLMGWRVP